MVVLGPITLRTPDILSTEEFTGIVGATAGILGSEMAASSVISATQLTGDMALAAGMATKFGLGALAWYGATKTEGTMKHVLYLGSVGCMSSMAIDVIHKVWPRATAGLAARYGAPMIAAPIRYMRPSVAPVTERPMGITIKR